MKSYVLVLIWAIWAVFFGAGLYSKSIGLEHEGNSLLIMALPFSGILLGWSLHAKKGGK
jgi:hypothetical protein